MTAAKDGPLDDVLMPPETLAERIGADNRMFETGVKAGREQVYAERILSAVERSNRDKVDEAVGAIARDAIHDYISAGLDIAEAGIGSDSTAADVIASIRNLHLAEPHLPATKIRQKLRERGLLADMSVEDDLADLESWIVALAIAAGIDFDEDNHHLSSTALRAETQIKSMRESLDMRVDLAPGSYWVFGPSGRTPVIVTREGRLIWAQRDDDGKLDGTYVDMTGAYSPGMWTFEPRRGDDQ